MSYWRDYLPFAIYPAPSGSSTEWPLSATPESPGRHLSCGSLPSGALRAPEMMDTQSARRDLGHLWALIAVARRRLLSEDDRKEITRLCGQIESACAGTTEPYPERAEALCRKVLSASKALSPEEEPRVDALLAEIDEVRALVPEQSSPKEIGFSLR